MIGETSNADREIPVARPVRADARRNMDALLEAALAVFATSGVDAVFRHEVDACADAASALAAEHAPAEALARWMQRYVDFIAAKRGLAAALRSGDPAFEALPGYFEKRLVPALRVLLNTAAAAGEVRDDVEPYDLLRAVGDLGMSAHYDGPAHARRMVALLVDGLRFGANPAADKRS